MADSIGHFGEYVRWHRIQSGQTTDAFGSAIGVTARRLVAIEAMPQPVVQHTTLVAIAKGMGFTLAELDRAWRTTGVTVTRRKAGPSNDEARRYAQACREAGVSPAEGMRRVRSWLVVQDSATQHAALSFKRGTGDDGSEFNQLVEHLQDPAQAARQRVGRAATSAKPRGSASTSAGKHR